MTPETPGQAGSSDAGLTPAMRQYRQYKAQYPDALLLFRMGDFYEMFWDDAVLASKVLGVALTSRSKGPDAIPMAGVPYHALDTYLRRLIQAGYRAAICEQMEDPALAKGLIKREVVRIVTPGTLTEDPLLESRGENLLASLVAGESRDGEFLTGLAWIELSTGAVWAFSGPQRVVLDQLAALRPAEVLLPTPAASREHPLAEKLKSLGVPAITHRADWEFSTWHAEEVIKAQWQAVTVGGFGFEAGEPAVLALGAALSYVRETQKSAPPHLRPARKYIPEGFLAIDVSSWRSLEIDRNTRKGTSEGTLLSAIDLTETGMGARLLRQWLRSPLREIEQIESRQQVVSLLVDLPQALKALREHLSGICDLERVVARLAMNRSSPRDLKQLGLSLAGIPGLCDELRRLSPGMAIAPDLDACREFCMAQGGVLVSAIVDEPPLHLREGGVFKAGFNAELDRLRGLVENSRDWLAKYQGELSQSSQIPSLKVAYNRVFGYYIEVSDAHRAKVPANWVRKQTLKNAERYTTPELKTFEEEALSARDRSIAMEQELFAGLRSAMLPELPRVQDVAQHIARLDTLASLASVARKWNYVRPLLHDGREIEIVGGRHPVLEQQVGREFVPNDLVMRDQDALLLITGPNMAGKSTYIRQNALIVILAQVGSFVPAAQARIGVADRIFTRIGASDELYAGQSTFMVEMIETANILNNASPSSLVVLDEIGRGTSTLDGLSLACAIAEQLAGSIRSRTLFATHYHELTELSQTTPGVRNLSVSVREWNEQVVFLHKIVEGGTDRSYGLHVAKLAGVPRHVVDRAAKLLRDLEVSGFRRVRGRKASDGQLDLFVDPGVAVIEDLRHLDLVNLTPEAALKQIKLWASQHVRQPGRMGVE